MGFVVAASTIGEQLGLFKVTYGDGEIRVDEALDVALADTLAVFQNRGDVDALCLPDALVDLVDHAALCVTARSVKYSDVLFILMLGEFKQHRKVVLADSIFLDDYPVFWVLRPYEVGIGSIHAPILHLRHATRI